MRFRAAALVLLPLALPVAAQEVPPPRDEAITAPLVLPTGPSPTPTPDPAPTPPPPVVGLPAPVGPTPRARATPRAAPMAEPSPSSSPTPRPTPAPSATPTPRPTARAPVVSVPAAVPTPAASATPTVPPLAAAPERGRGAWWLVLPLLALIAAAWMMLRRSRATGEVEEAADRPLAAAAADPAPVPVPVPAPSAPPSIALRPLRIGLNLLTATFEGEIMLSSGQGMEDVRVSLHLMAASRDEGQAIAALHDAPIGRTVVPAFALAPGSARTVRGIGVLGREATGGLEAAGRPLFVPLVAVRVGWRDTNGARRHLTQAFAVGVERVDSPRLAPIWLDQPARSYEQIAARPHGSPMVGEVAEGR